jgi:uncharacterized damage-inducible protein DinB
LTERGLHGGKAVKENSAIFQSYSKTLWHLCYIIEIFISLEWMLLQL